MKGQYVSFEVAKLLKEKGFDEKTVYHYTNCDVLQHNIEYNEYKNSEMLNAYSAPTQQMACSWLREEHNILVTVLPCEVGAGVMDYTYCIYEIQADDYHFEPICQGRIEPVAYTCDYEGTIEAALKYCLTNLI